MKQIIAIFTLLFALQSFSASMPGTTRTEFVSSGVEKDVTSTRDYDRFFFRNDCYVPVFVYLNILDLNNDWTADGPWLLEPGETGYIADTRNTVYYFAAVSQDSKFIWKGSTPVTISTGETLGMITGQITTTQWGDWIQVLTCN